MLRHTLHSPQRGMSLVELLVATVISLLGVLIIFQVFAVNEDVRRTTTSGSDEQTSGLMALMSLERDLRHAGFGINDFALVGCKMSMYDNHALADHPRPNFPWRRSRSSPTRALSRTSSASSTAAASRLRRRSSSAATWRQPSSR